MLFDKIARGLSARIVVTAAYIYILQVVYAVWTSAYNFVPFGGTLTRETSHVLVFFNFLGIYFGVYTASKKIRWFFLKYRRRILCLEYNLGTYIRGRVASISLPNRKVWTGLKT